MARPLSPLQFQLWNKNAGRIQWIWWMCALFSVWPFTYSQGRPVLVSEARAQAFSLKHLSRDLRLKIYTIGWVYGKGKTVYQGTAAHFECMFWLLSPCLTKYFREFNLFEQTANLPPCGIIIPMRHHVHDGKKSPIYNYGWGKVSDNWGWGSWCLVSQVPNKYVSNETVCKSASINMSSAVSGFCGSLTKTQLQLE